jgi:hypothetical protein
MSDQKIQNATNDLTDQQLDGVQGGNSIDKFPSPRTPKFGPPGSIAQGEINSNSTDDNLPDSGGGIIV